jgi:hypothetical protein
MLQKGAVVGLFQSTALGSPSDFRAVDDCSTGQDDSELRGL